MVIREAVEAISHEPMLASGKVGARPGAVLNPAQQMVSALSQFEFKSLKWASLGLQTAEVARLSGYSEGYAKNVRSNLISKLHARHLPHAVYMGCVANAFPDQLEEAPVQSSDIPALMVEEFDLLAHGLTHFEIARALGRKKTTVNTSLARGRQKVVAKTVPHAVRILFESGLLTR